MGILNITSINGDHLKFAYNLEVIKETSRSIYAQSMLYGWVYRIEKQSGRVFLDRKLIGETCTYTKF